jgi:RNA polymerase sigma-70 factor (ECF subfamily)
MDEAAFSSFYQATAPALEGYIRRLCGDAALAEDIFQEAFYRLLRADLPKMDAPQIKAYLFKIATSLLVDHWRRAGRERFWKSLWHRPALQAPPGGQEVSQALYSLRPVERALLWLAYVEGFDHREIAFACCCFGRARSWRAISGSRRMPG